MDMKKKFECWQFTFQSMQLKIQEAENQSAPAISVLLLDVTSITPDDIWDVAKAASFLNKTQKEWRKRHNIERTEIKKKARAEMESPAKRRRLSPLASGSDDPLRK